MPNPSDPHDRAARRRIVYIEDNTSNFALMQRLVKHRPGVELLHARDGATGVALVRETQPDVVFLDLYLPDFPGDEVLRQLREGSDTASIPVVILSADAMPNRRQELLASGVLRYITKPIDVMEVLGVIDELLGG